MVSMFLVSAVFPACTALSSPDLDETASADQATALSVALPSGDYRLVNVNSGLFLGTPAGDTGLAQVPVSAASTWNFVREDDGSYAIAPTFDSRCLGLDAGGDGARARVQPCSYTEADRWSLVPASGGGYDLVNAASGKCLEIAAWARNVNAGANQWSCNGGANQHWRVMPTTQAFRSATTVQMRNLNSNGWLTVAGAATSNGSPTRQASNVTSYVGSAWTFEPQSDGSYMIRDTNSRRCIEALAWTRDNGAAMDVWDCNGGANQRWNLNPVGSPNAGAYQIVNVNSGKCLEVGGWSRDDDALINQWDCTGGANQTWALADFTFDATSCSGPPLTATSVTGPLPKSLGLVRLGFRRRYCGSTSCPAWSTPTTVATAAATLQRVGQELRIVASFPTWGDLTCRRADGPSGAWACGGANFRTGSVVVTPTCAQWKSTVLNAGFEQQETAFSLQFDPR